VLQQEMNLFQLSYPRKRTQSNSSALTYSS
jgi:hypothetical protein